MSNATFTFGRFNPPTEEGHGKLVSAVQKHAEETGGQHYVFPTHTQDKKKNPMTHSDKVGAMKKLFPKANIVSHPDIRTAIGAVQHLQDKGHTHVTMVVGSDRVDEFHGLLNKYRKKEFPKVKKINVISAGHRDPDAEGAEGMSASKLRGLVSSGKKKEFVSHYSDPKLGAKIHDQVKAGMQMESTNPVGIFLLGGPGSGKDYVLKNIFSRFDLQEVQADQVLSGSCYFTEHKHNVVINGIADADKIEIIKSLLEGYDFDFVHVTVSNKISRIRNSMRANPLPENRRIEKWLKAEQLSETYDCFKFNNSINLNESTDMEQIMFAAQIEKLLERIVQHGLEIKQIQETVAAKPLKAIVESNIRKESKIEFKKFKAIKEEKYVEGTNCLNCKFIDHDKEQKVEESELNPNGGLKAPDDAYLKMSKEVDLVSLPGKDSKVDEKYWCDHDKVENWVTERMCCALWDGKGTRREYKGESPVFKEDIDSIFEAQIEAKVPAKSFREIRSTVDLTPNLNTKQKKSRPVPPTDYRSTLAGMPVVTAKMNESETK